MYYNFYRINAKSAKIAILYHRLYQALGLHMKG